jgi:Putative peptidoglycan binding domain
MAEPVLQKGSTDPAVRDLQQALKALGHDPGPVDGVFGVATESAVKTFQQERQRDCRQGHLGQHRRGRPERTRPTSSLVRIGSNSWKRTPEIDGGFRPLTSRDSGDVAQHQSSECRAA